MTYRQAMNQKCKCGKFVVGGWIGTRGKGYPNFARVSCPRVFSPCISICEEHTLEACYAPQKITQ